VEDDVDYISLQIEPINVGLEISKCGSEADGAIVTFIGKPRNGSREKAVQYLEYEAYQPMALSELEKIVTHVKRTWPVNDCIVVHRYGIVTLDEPSILIAVSSAHRAEAFESTRYIIDTIKKTVPIWKKEYYQDGSMWITEHP